MQFKEQLLFRLVQLMFEKQQTHLLLDDLYEDEVVGSFFRNIQIDSPFQQLLFEGVLSQSITGDSISVSFTVEAYFQYVLAKYLHTDNRYASPESLLRLLKENKLKGLPEAVSNLLSFDVEKGDFTRITDFIDLNEEGKETLDLCVMPLIQSLKVNGVNRTLKILLHNVSNSDFIVISKSWDLLEDLEIESFYEEIANFLVEIENKEIKLITNLSFKIIPYLNTERRLELEKSFNNLTEINELREFANYLRITARYQEAIEVYNVIIKNKNQNPVIQNQIGYCYNKLELYNEAETYYLKAFEIYEKNKIKNNETIYNLGLINKYKNNSEKSLMLMKEALDIELKEFGKYHSAIANTYIGIGDNYTFNKDFNSALEYLYEAIGIIINCKGENHIDLSNAYGVLATCFYHKNDFENALKYFKLSATIKKYKFGVSNIEYIKAINNIAIIYHYTLNDLNNALYYYLEIEKATNELSSNVDLKYNINYSIGGCFYTNEDYNQALNHLIKAFQIKKDANCALLIGICYEYMELLNDSFDYYLISAELAKLKHGNDAEITKEAIDESKRLAKELNKENELPDWIKEI
jgi:tetratricopeptide (TPR) repeat protein